MERIYSRAASRRAIALILFASALARISAARAQTTSSSRRNATSDLAALVREGLAHNPRVIAARERWEAFERAPIQARTLPDPQVQTQEFTVGSPQPGAGYETSSFYYTGIGASQEIPGPGKLRLRGAIAEKDAEIAQRQYETTQREAAEKIRESYFELFYLARTTTLLERQRRDVERIERIAEARYRLNQAQAEDVLKAQLQATRMLDDIAHHYREMQQRQADLKAALGRYPDSPNIPIGDIGPTRVDVTEAQLEGAVKKHSTEVMTDRAAAGRADKALALARKGYIPDFTLAYMYQKTGPGFRDYYMLTLGAKIPLYFWCRQTPAIEEAELNRASARSQIRADELDAGAAAEDQLVAIRTSDRVLGIYREGLIPQAENSMRAALASYQVSKVDFQTLLSSFLDLLNVREEYYRELADHEIAVAKLEQIVGELK